MKKWLLGWTVALAFALAFGLAACGDDNKEKLCEKGDETCEVGNGKCVVGYDGECGDWGQVCYAGEGAPKGKPGTCTDGQFDENGKLIAVVVAGGLEQGAGGFEQGGRHVGATGAPWIRQRECFSSCPVWDLMPPLGLGRAPATLMVTVQGPHAETEQLQATVRGVEYKDCEKTGGPSKGRQGWQCNFPAEDWAGINTTESLELKLWTQSSQKFPWISHHWVDTRPFELEDLHLEARTEEGFLEVAVEKKGAHRWGPLSGHGTMLAEVHYANLEVFTNGIRIPGVWNPITIKHFQTTIWGNVARQMPADSQIELPDDIQPGDTLEIRATVSAKDFAGNEVSNVELTHTLTL